MRRTRCSIKDSGSRSMKYIGFSPMAHNALSSLPPSLNKYWRWQISSWMIPFAFWWSVMSWPSMESSSSSSQSKRKNSNSRPYAIFTTPSPLLKQWYSAIRRRRWSGWQRKWGKQTSLCPTCTAPCRRRKEMPLWVSSGEASPGCSLPLTSGVEAWMYSKCH